jgi:flagellar motor protein MotB
MSANHQEDEDYYKKEQETMLDQMIEQATEAVAMGENVDQILEIMLSSATGKQKEAIKQKFTALLKKRGLAMPKGESDIPSHNVLDRIRNALAMTAKQAFDRVMALMQSRPDVASQVAEAGRMLAKNGVMIERIQMSESELGTIAPTAIGKSQGRNNEVGR